LVGENPADVEIADRSRPAVPHLFVDVARPFLEPKTLVPPAGQVGAGGELAQDRGDAGEVADPLVDLQGPLGKRLLALATEPDVRKIEDEVSAGECCLRGASRRVRLGDRPGRPLARVLRALLVDAGPPVPGTELSSDCSRGLALDVFEQLQPAFEPPEQPWILSQTQRDGHLLDDEPRFRARVVEVEMLPCDSVRSARALVLAE
jgi:hypothetical protein